MTAEELNHLEYQRTDLSVHIPPECDLIHEYLEDATLVGNKVLEVGPGNGRTVTYLLEQGLTVDVLDHSQEVLDALVTNLVKYQVPSDSLKITKADIVTAELGESVYSLVSVSHVLHFLHFNAIPVVLSKIKQALALGGILFFRGHSSNDPHAPEVGDYVKHFFSQEDFRWFEENGFKRLYFSEVRCRSSVRSARFRSSAEGFPEDFDYYLEGEQVHFDAVFRRDR